MCGYTANADVNGARNILVAGHAVLACGGIGPSDCPLKDVEDVCAQHGRDLGGESPPAS